MPVTLQDVAIAARVSSATVSKVLNNRYDVAPETVELVESAIRRVGYQRSATRRGRPTSALHPPAMTRAQRPKAATGIALLIPSTRIEAMQSPLTGQLVHGAETVARKQGLHFYLTRFADDERLPACLDPVQVDGLIVRNTVEDLKASLPSIPTIWIFKLGYTPTPGDLVQPDNELIGKMAASYLLERGHQHLAVVTARLHHAESQVRADRFVRFARSSGATVLTTESHKDVDVVAEQLLSESPRVTGLFMPLGDHYLEGLYRALQRRGISCGGSKDADINLISCNNDMTHLRVLDPTLPNIDIRAAEVGQAAAETLLWRIQHPREHRRCILIEPRLVEPALANAIPNEE
jgi:LacI family transcriptional regulator